MHCTPVCERLRQLRAAFRLWRQTVLGSRGLPGDCSTVGWATIDNTAMAHRIFAVNGCPQRQDLSIRNEAIMMSREARGISVYSVAGLMAIGSLSLALLTTFAEAKPKKLAVGESCTCGCEFQDAEGTWHWGNDVNFHSSNCGQWKNKKQSCMTPGGAVDGRLTMCMPVDKNPAPFEGGNAGVFDPGNSPPPSGTVGGPSGTRLLLPGQ